MLDELNLRYITNNKIIELTKIETIALSVLIKERGKVVSYPMLEWALYQDITGNNNNIRGIIKKLRNKLNGVLEIKTRQKRGYYI